MHLNFFFRNSFSAEPHHQSQLSSINETIAILEKVS